MKVILLEDVKKLGKKDEIMEVADGYAMNYLIPNELAVIASSTSRQILEDEREDRIEERKVAREEALKSKEEIDDLTLEFEVTTGENGRVFGSVSTKKIERYLKEEHNIEVNRRKFKPSKALTNLGLHTIEVTLYPKVVAELKVRLVEEA